MTDSRTRPARDRARLELLIMANRWFWKEMDVHAGCTWSHAISWKDERSSTQIRRFMTAVRAGDVAAVAAYTGSDADVSQVPDALDDGGQPIERDEIRELAAS